MTPSTTVTRIGQNLCLELDTDQSEGIRDQLMFAAKQLNDIYTQLCL